MGAKGCTRLGQALAMALALCALPAPAQEPDGANALVAADASIDDGLAVTALPIDGGVAPSLAEALGELDLSGLAPGVHRVQVRFQDKTGEWSVPIAQSLLVEDRITGDGAATGHIAAAEVYFDTDPGAGFGIPLPPPEDGFFDGRLERLLADVDLSHLTAGVHAAYLRVRDDEGHWSAPIAQSLLIEDRSTGGGAAAGHIAAAEVYFDADPGPGFGIPLPPPEDGFFDGRLERLLADVDLSHLAAGVHAVYLRVRDDNSHWSAPIAQSLLIEDGSPGGGAAAGRIVAAEVFFDTDPGPGFGWPLSGADGADLDALLARVQDVVPLADLTPGLHSLHLRVQSDAGIWSDALAQSLLVPDTAQGGSGAVTLIGAEVAVDGGPFEPAPAADGAFGGLIEGVDLERPVVTGVNHAARVRFIDSLGRVSGEPSGGDGDPYDSDWDGLPDAWELARFGTLALNGRDDPDGDGLTNAEEFLQDTNPLVPDQPGLLTISGFVRESGGLGVAGVAICHAGGDGAEVCSAQTDELGHYVLGSDAPLERGTYRVWPQSGGGDSEYGFSPASRTFTLEADPLAAIDFVARPLALDLLSPAGGGTYRANDRPTLTWSGNGGPDRTLELAMKRDAVPADRAAPLPGDPDWVILAADSANDGAEQIRIPAGLTPASDWRFTVGYTGTAVQAQSAVPFTWVPSADLVVSELLLAPRRGLSFDGSDDRVVLTNEETRFDLGTWTIEARVTPAAETPAGEGPVVWMSQAGDGDAPAFALTWRGDRFAALVADAVTGAVHETQSEPLAPEIGYAVAASFDGERLRLYVDGVEQGQATLAAPVAPPQGLAPLLFGHDGRPAGGALAGTLDEVRLWSVARDPDDIDRDQHRRLRGTETGLVGLWSFDEPDGDLALDRVPGGRDGLLGGGQPEWAPLRILAPPDGAPVAEPGDPIEVLWTVANVGEAATGGALADRLWLSADAALDGGDVLLATLAATAALPPGADDRRDAMPSLPWTIAAGDWYLLVQADGTGGESESDEQNNLAAGLLDVRTGPPPEPPVVAPVTSPTNFAVQTLTGTKPPRTAILIDDETVVPVGASTTWSYAVALAPGVNAFTLRTRDAASNRSPPVSVTIVHDDAAPLPVTPLAVDAAGDGTSALLDWSGYDEAIQGDIAGYRVYVADGLFTQVGALTPLAEMPAGTLSYRAQGLTRDTTYWFAVVAVDTKGNANPSVTPVSATSSDIVGPEAPSGLVIDSFADRIVARWQPSANSAGDLAGYRVHVGDPAAVSTLDAATRAFEATGLQPASGYPLRVEAIDADGNAGPAAQTTAVTLLPNPVLSAAEPFDKAVELTWQAVSPAQYVRHYAVYRATSDFTSVAGLAPVMTTGGNSARVTGLGNDTPYFFAVTTVNTSGGGDQAVSTLSATPRPDTLGPTLSNIAFDGVPLTDGAVLVRAGVLSAAATDPSGISRVEFAVDAAHIGTDNAGPGFAVPWDVAQDTDGAHTLTVSAFDTLGNRTDVALSVTVDLAPPTAPVITQPAAGLVTNQAHVTVSGTAAEGSEVLLYRGGEQVAGPLALDAYRRFSAPVTLLEGENTLHAAARNRGGVGPSSTAVLVTRDTSIPQATGNLFAQAREAGVVRLTWAAVDADIAGYEVYRATTPFADLGAAVKANSGLITGTRFDDLPGSDGRYYYSVVARNAAGTASPLSNQVDVRADATPPVALALDYSPQGAYDPQGGRFGVGRVDLTLRVSEALLATPFLTLTPEAGIPIPVALTQVGETEYQGQVEITERTPAGVAYAVFSARDRVGNRGTEILAGESVLIDTEGPRVIGLTITPAEPIRNDPEPAQIQLELELDEPPAGGAAPAVGWLLSAPGREPVSLAVAATGERTWAGSFVLPADAGAGGAETLEIQFSAADDLGNVGDAIAAGNRFQVYQGELPPLDTPTDLSAEALPGGAVALSWSPVASAVDYLVYRAGPGDAELAPYLRSGGAVELTDATSIDGVHRYAVASVRQANGQEALSARSAEVAVAADATPPDAPAGLTLELTGAGVRARWQAPEDAAPLTYRLYRDAAEVLSTDGLTPVLTGLTETEAVDGAPSQTDHHYSVTALDPAGNESAPAPSVYLNFELLPVADLEVVQRDEGLPQLGWAASGAVLSGYNVYLLDGAAPLGLTQTPIAQPEYIDSGWLGEQRRYAVTAVDTEGVEGPAREVLLPRLGIELADASLQRGLMNRLDYQVRNDSDVVLSGVRVRAEIAGYNSSSAPFDLAVGETRAVSVIVGGHADLPAVAEILTHVEVLGATGDRADLMRTAELEIGDGTLALGILPEAFTRGGSGRVRFSIENTSDVEVEIVTATGQGGADSNEVRLELRDGDNNLLVVEPLRQALGAGLVTLPNGKTVARIAPGERFMSAPLDLEVPLAAPDQVYLHLIIDHLHHHLGQADAVTIDGLASRRAITLVDVAYSGQVSDAQPASSFGEQPIQIAGAAQATATGAPMPFVPLDLVIAANGFERVVEVATDRDGQFSYRFEPLPTESGVYQVAAVHPDLQDRPAQAEFTIGRVLASPNLVQLRMPRGYDQAVPIRLTTGPGTSVTHLRLVFDAADQPLGALPAGITLDLPTAVALGANASAQYDVGVRADETAAATGTLVLVAKSAESGDQALATIRIDYLLSEARPALSFSPSYLETGVARGERITQTLTLENRGLATLEDVRLALTSPDGGAAPAWLSLASSPHPGDLGVGAKLSVNVSAAPTDQVPEGIHEYRLVIGSANASEARVNGYVSVSQADIGNVLFHVADIYTATLDAEGELIQGLAGARIRLQNEQVPSIDQTLSTDAYGEAFFEGLPAGRYKYKASAPDHHDVTGRLWIRPGVTTAEEVFLDYDLVSVEWEVNEITLEDRYEITLNATYETDVPAPVVVIEPASINLPEMQAGDVYYGELTLTNHGLIRAEEVGFSLPQDAAFKIELLAALPTSLEAKQRVTIPYRVTALASTDGATDGSASGGGCQTRVLTIRVHYVYQCSNGEVRSGTATQHFFYTAGECERAEVEQSVTRISIGGGGGGGSSGGGGWGPGLEPIDGVVCWPISKRYEVVSDRSLGEFIWFNVGCGANTVLREFQDEALDLRVKVPGGVVQVQRRFYGNAWHWDHERTRLGFERDPLTNKVERISRGGVLYEPLVAGNDTLFVNEYFEIVRDGDAWLWQDKTGGWWRYDAQGRSVAFGTRTGTIGKLIYADGSAPHPAGITDRNDMQVLWFDYDQAGLLTAVRDANARRVDYRYTGDRLTAVTDAIGGETRYEYDADGRMTRKLDPAGRPTLVGYDRFGDIESVTGADGTGTWFEFDYDERTKQRYAQLHSSSGKVTEVWYSEAGEVRRVDVNGRTYRTVSEDGRIEITTDEKGNVTRREHDEWDNLRRVVYPDGSEVRFDYDDRFHLVNRAVDLRGHVNRYSYDAQGSLTTKIEAVGTAVERTTRFVYDEAGQLTEITLEGDADTETATTRFTYDAHGNIASITDPEGHRTELIEYHAMGNLLRLRDPRGYEWGFAYDALGRLLSKTDPEGNQTTYEYDGANNATAVIDAQARRFGFSFNDDNQITRSIDPLGYEEAIDYNSDGLPVRLTDKAGRTVEHRYDSEGRLLGSLVGPLASGYETAYQYDDSNATFAASSLPVQVNHPTYATRNYYDRMQRLVRSVDVLDADTEYSSSIEYDIAGNPIATIDAEGRTTRYTYDALNRVSAVQDASGEVTSYRYDDLGNVIAITDPNGGETLLEYDRNGKLTALIRPLGQTTRYEYDAAGNRTAAIDAKGQRIEYDYSPANRLVQERHYAADDLDAPAKTIDYSYDELGRLTGYEDGVTSGTYAYDALGRKTGVTVNYGPISLSYAYTYDANGLKETFTGPDGITYRYLYDQANRLSAIELPDGSRVTYSGYRWNRPEQVTLPGGTTLDYVYDPLQRLTAIQGTTPGGDATLAYDYTLSPLGRVSSKQTEVGQHAYDYDALDRLLEASNPVLDDERFTYDALGNRLTSAGTAGAWDYDLNNRLLGFDEQTLEYDDNGNLIRQASPARDVRYVYDIKDRLVRVEREDGSVLAEYYYNPFGRRLWKDVNGVRTHYAYADEGLIGEYDANGGQLRSYGYRPDSLWTTDPLFQKVGNSYYWYQNDHLGTPQKLVDASGSTVWAANYTAFGQAHVTVALVENNLRFPGQYYDQETGLHYNWHRYYNPQSGRYLTADPLNDGLNPYTYALNNPLLLIDPEGTHSLRVVGGIAQIVSGIALIGGSGGLGAAGGILLILNGLDNLVAGGNSLASQENRRALLESAVYELVPEQYAPWVYIATQVAIPAGALKLAHTGQAQVAGQQVVANGGDDVVNVYRVFGGDARAQGFSWTTHDPRTISNFRDVAGLPSGGASGATNSADFLLKGKVHAANIINSRAALPLDGNTGGLAELIIDPKNVRIVDFSVLNP